MCFSMKLLSMPVIAVSFLSLATGCLSSSSGEANLTKEFDKIIATLQPLQAFEDAKVWREERKQAEEDWATHEKRMAELMAAIEKSIEEIKGLDNGDDNGTTPPDGPPCP